MGSPVSCLSVFFRLTVRTSEHSLKLETGTKCQVDRSSFLCYSQIRLCGGKICTWWPWKPVLTQATAYTADKLTRRNEPCMKCNGSKASISLFAKVVWVVDRSMTTLPFFTLQYTTAAFAAFTHDRFHYEIVFAAWRSLVACFNML